MDLELKNMYIIQEENKDLREDLDRLKSISYDQKVKEMQVENSELRKRNGQLLIELDDWKKKCTDGAKDHQQQILEGMRNQDVTQRPQTAQVSREQQSLLDDEDLQNAQTVFDKELNELLAKNQ